MSQQITTLSAATSEFLRQFWTALYPPTQDDPRRISLASASPAAREAKILKMVGFLALTHDKVNAIYEMGRHQALDLAVIETASRGISGLSNACED